MKLKLKYIVGAIAAIGSAAAFAASPALNPTSDTPDTTFYIAGASAQKAGIQYVAAGKFFDTPANVVYITSSLTKDTANFSNPQNFPQGSIGFFGWSKASLTGGTSKKLLVLFSSANGSAAGINQVIAANGAAPEAQVVNVGPTATCVSNSLTAGGLSSTGQLTAYKCAGYTARVADVALSDVRVSEFPATDDLGNPVIVGNAAALSETIQTALEGFGIVANNNMYFALQQQNVADGILAASCITGNSATNYNTTAACQPTISKAQYANIAAGNYGSAADLLPGVLPAGTGVLNLVRRVPTSGTQAASGIYFLGAPCLSLLGNAQVPAIAGSYGNFNVIEGSQTDDVLSAMKNPAQPASLTSGYNIGVVSLEKADSDLGSANATTYQGRFVRLNNSSSNYQFADATSYDPKRRSNIIRGTYDFVTEMAAYVGGTANTALATELLNDIQDPSQSNIAGIAYLQGTPVAGLSAAVSRSGNNCNPLQ